MAFAQSHPLNAFKTFTATPSSGISGNSSNNKPIKELVLMPDDEHVYGPPSNVSAYSEYELSMNTKPSIPMSSSTPGQMNTCANSLTSPQSHEIGPPPYHQYIAQQQQQRQILQQQHYPVVTARSITSPSDQVISNSYAEVVFQQRSGIRRTSDFSSPSSGSRGMRPPPSPQPRPPIPAHSPNSKMRTFSDPVHNGMLSSSHPPPPPPHGRPLSGSIGQNKTPPSMTSSFSSSVQNYTPSVPLDMSVSNNYSASTQYYQHQLSQSSTSQSSTSQHNFIQFPHTSIHQSMSFPISRSRVISRSNDSLDGPPYNSNAIHIPEPPRLPPQSGVLHRTTGKVVLKPHAFKPVTPRSQSGSASCHSSPLRLNESPSPCESPPAAQNFSREGMRPRSQTGRSQDGSSSLSSGTVPIISAPTLEIAHGLDDMPASCPPPAFANSNGPATKSIPVVPSPALELSAANKVICNGDETPLSSICRSVSDHELVRQRETELMTLRRTMEQNEEAMLRVFEERRNELEKQLNAEQQCVAKLEASLQATTLQLRQTELRLADCESQLHSRQMKATPPPLPPHSSGSRPPSMAGASRRDSAVQTTDDLMEKLEALQRQLSAREAIFEVERNQWLEEKSKVISYQKQMQLNYVQLCSKNQRLESEVQQLTLDLERKDLHLSSLANGISR